MSDIAITAASVLPSATANITQGIAGETLTAGQPVYKSASDGRLYLADANVLAKINVVGLSVNGASAGQLMNYCTKDADFTLGGTVAAGGVVILSATAGAVCLDADLATGSYLVILGGGNGSNKINFSPLVCGLKP